MARSFKPTVSYTDNRGTSKHFSVGTYAAVKRRMNEFIDDSVDGCVSVYRHRRGEWGEWWEHWGRAGGKVKITGEGWS